MSTNDPWAIWPPPVHCTTSVPNCWTCGKPFNFGVHGSGICDKPKAGTVHYIGVTPEQVRQIVREELERAAAGKSEERK